MRRLLLVLLVAFPFVAQAYPWCLMRDGRPQCKFITKESCYNAVEKFGGDCRANPREVGVLANGPFCVITGAVRDCRYFSKGRCLANARKLSGGCVPNTDESLKRAAAGKSRAEECFAGQEGCARKAPELVEDRSGIEDGFLLNDAGF